MLFVCVYVINRDGGDESLPLLAFQRQCCQCNFSEIFKGRQIILEPIRNSKYLIRCLLWWHKTLPVCYDDTVTLHLDIWRGSEYVSAEKQGRCKVCKKNSLCRYVKCKSTWYRFWNISMILANVWLRNDGWKIYELVLFNNIFVQLFWSWFFFFYFS